MSDMNEYQRKLVAEEEARKEYDRKTKELAKIIKPISNAAYECDYDWMYFFKFLEDMKADYGGLELNPDFQRGHVWTPEQKQHYIENVIRGIVPSSGFLVQFNCANWNDFDSYKGTLPAGLQCIDGLQRITAVRDFLSGDVKPFGLHYLDFHGSRFSVKGNYRFRIAIYNFKNKADVLQHYLDFNCGGTPHPQSEIERIKEMKANLA